MKSFVLFDCLVLGLAKLIDQEFLYPYPDLFQQACNQLSLQMEAGQYPLTMMGLFNLFEQPVKSWCPFQIPESFERDFGLVTDHRLSEEAAEYLHMELREKAEIPESASAVVQKLFAEHYQFQKLFERLRDQYRSDPVVAQHDYILLRKFLIEHPFVEISQIRRTFRRAQYLDIEEVGGLYDPCSDGDTYWNCDRCGPLFQKYGHLYGSKPSFCDDHRRSLPFVNRIEGTRELLKIKQGIHLRVCLPGIPELALLGRMQELARDYPDTLSSIDLYPGVDRYDLKLTFSDDAVWGTDVKAYCSPYLLRQKLPGIYGEGNLAYTKGFYVVPERRLRGHSEYLKIVREKVKLPDHTCILSDVEFEDRVLFKIKSLQPED